MHFSHKGFSRKLSHFPSKNRHFQCVFLTDFVTTPPANAWSNRSEFYTRCSHMSCLLPSIIWFILNKYSVRYGQLSDPYCCKNCENWVSLKCPRVLEKKDVCVKFIS